MKIVDDMQPSGDNMPYMKAEDAQYFQKLLVRSVAVCVVHPLGTRYAGCIVRAVGQCTLYSYICIHNIQCTCMYCIIQVHVHVHFMS